MSIQLAHWLAEHQPLLLPRWESSMRTTLPSNGHNAGGTTTEVLEDNTTVVFSLPQLYSGLVQAAGGDPAALDAQLETMGSAQQEHLSLPDLLQSIAQFRRLAWEVFQRSDDDTSARFALMSDLEDLLQHTSDVLARAWDIATDMAIHRSKEEIEFLAQSMNATMEQVDETAVQLSLMNALSQQLSSSLESSDSAYIINVVGSKLMEIFHLHHISIWLPDEEMQRETSEVVLYAAQTWGKESHPIAGMRLSAVIDETWPNDIITQSYVLSQPVIAIEPLPDAQRQGNWYQPGCSVMALPLLVKDRASGVVVLQDAYSSGHFDAAQQDTLRAAVNQAAIALDNARLYAQVRRFNSDLEQLVAQRTAEVQAEKERLRTLHEIATEVSSTLDLDKLLHTSLEALARITRVQYGSIMLVERETDHLVNHAVLGQETINTFTRFPIGHGVAGWVAQYKKPALIPDITQDQRWVMLPLSATESASKKNRGSMVAVPLIAHNEPLGVLTLSHSEIGYFNEDHLRLLTASAGAIAIGIHNANLYNEIVKDMEHRGEMLLHQQMVASQTEAILQSLSDGVLVCDPEGGVLSANPACALILQRTVEELVLSNLHDLLERLMGKRAHELPLAELLARPLGANDMPRTFESTVHLGMKVLSLHLGPVMKENGELVGALLVLRDKTREVQSDRLKTEFIGTMSHELRTPMTAIKGFTQLLVMGSLGPVNDTQREFLNTIQTNAERMISIINDVLELTKIETSSVDLEVRPIHLAEALSGVVSELQGQADNREHTLNISIPPGLPLVRADANRLHQILFNLVSNAIKYTPQGGEIWVEARETAFDDLPQSVRDSVTGGRRYLRIDVRDTGVGIAEHELDKVFERFYRTENPLKIEAGGTGLGLSLTRPLIELLGGRIWVTSVLNEGSSFSFILPTV